MMYISQDCQDYKYQQEDQNIQPIFINNLLYILKFSFILIFSLVMQASKSKCEVKLPCPFDSNHQILAEKLLKHIKNCKSPTRRDFVVCPFNPYHWVNFMQLEQHKCQCPDSSMSFHQEKSRYSSKNNEGFNSFISQIHLNQSFNQRSQIHKLSMDFQEFKPAHNEINIRKKKINQQELRSINKDSKKWEEPNFEEWYELNYKNKNKSKKYILREEPLDF